MLNMGFLWSWDKRFRLKPKRFLSIVTSKPAHDIPGTSPNCPLKALTSGNYRGPSRDSQRTNTKLYDYLMWMKKILRYKFLRYLFLRILPLLTVKKTTLWKQIKGAMKKVCFIYLENTYFLKIIHFWTYCRGHQHVKESCW